MTCRGDLECDSVAAALDSRTIRDQSVDSSPTRTAGTKSGSSATVLPKRFASAWVRQNSALIPAVADFKSRGAIEGAPVGSDPLRSTLDHGVEGGGRATKP